MLIASTTSDQSLDTRPGAGDRAAALGSQHALPAWWQVFQHSDIAMALGDRDNRTLVAVNAAFARMHGRSVADLCGAPLLELFAPRVRASLLDHIERANACTNYSWESWHVRADGSEFPVSIEVTPVRDSQGALTLRVGLVRDISERKQAERALRDSEARFRAMFELASVGQTQVDAASGHFVLANRRYCAMTGYAEAELQQLTPADITHADDRAGDGAAFAPLLRGELDEYEIEKRYVRKDGQVIWVHVATRLVRDAEARPLYSAGVIQDITARKNAERDLLLLNQSLEQRVAQRTAALRGAQQRLQLVLGSVAAVVFCAQVTDDLRASYVSENVRQVLGYEAHEFLDDARFWIDRVHPEDVERVVAAAAQAIERGERSFVEYRFRAGDGSYRWMQEEAQLVDNEHGAGRELVGYWIDVTERKDAERQLKAHQVELGRLQRQLLVRHTVAAVAHELNQPLNAVVSFNEAALRLLRTGNPKPEKLVRALEGGATQAQRAGETMRSLLALLHAEEAQPERLDLRETLRRSIEVFATESDRVVSVELDAEAGLPAVVAVAAHVENVLLNLLRNAAEATPAVAPAPAAIRVSVQRAPQLGFLQVSVRDYGAGVHPGLRSKIFDYFVTGKANGVGTGLAISRALIETLGGKLWLDADTHPGACFRFSVPCAP